MKNKSNDEVKIIDKNYVKRYDSTQNKKSKNFQNINLDGLEKHRSLKDLIKNLFENLKRKISSKKSNNLPNLNFQVRQNQKDFPQQLPNSNFKDSLNQAKQELFEMITKLLQNGQPKSNNHQQNKTKQHQSLQSLISKQNNTSVKEIDENYKNRESSQEQDNIDLDEQQEQSEQNNQPLSENMTKALESLVDKKIKSDGQDDEQFDSNNNLKQPNLDEESPRIATHSDSDGLTKLNVEWTNEDVARTPSEKTKSIEQTKNEDELLKLFFKYLVKTNYYVKTYGLDKKNKRQIAMHFLLGLEHKIMTDTYSNITQPLSFYIDMKGQCWHLNEYNDFFRRLLNQKGVSVYFGNKGKIVKYLKVKKPGANLDFSKCDMCHYFENSDILPNSAKADEHYESRIFNEHIPLEEFIRKHRISGLVAFSDFDAATSIIRSSSLAKIYWFCTNIKGGDINSYYYSLNDFKGEFIMASNISQVMEYFNHIDDSSYENKQRQLQLRR